MPSKWSDKFSRIKEAITFPQKEDDNGGDWKEIADKCEEKFEKFLTGKKQLIKYKNFNTFKEHFDYYQKDIDEMKEKIGENKNV